jgi:hypothetical protein
MASHTVIYGLHNRDDNMTLRDEIEKSREDLRKNSYQIMTDDDIERIIDRIDDIEEIVISKEFDIVTRLSKIEDELVNLNLRMDGVEFANKVHTAGGIIKITPDPEPQEPFPGYNDLLKEAILAIREYIAEKKRKLDHKVVPMKRSDFVEREGNRVGDWDISKANIPPELAGPDPYDLSAAHDFTGPGEHPEE